MILVTGGSGFIGTHLVNLLSQNGHSVRIFDLRKPKAKAKYVRGNILDSKALLSAAKGCDSIIHLAAQVDVQRSIREPLFDMRTNALGTLNVLEAARKIDAEKFVYASSAAVYGMPERLPISESHPVNPISPYGISKLSGEKYVLGYSRLYSMDTLALRLFNVYGKGQDTNSSYSGVITKFADAIKRNRPPVVFGSGAQTRDFVHVGDVSKAFMLALKSKKSGLAINIGSGREISVRELAKRMVAVSGKSLSPRHEAGKRGDIPKSVADTALAKKALNFRPAVSFDEGLAALIE